ncbi:MAG: cytidine deaminase [Archangiaceae bacterium]|nr:cytidine deaminase [Archangiaceae bacterium]
MSIDWKQLFAAAETARKRAYAPYSKFAVGAAVLADDGTIHLGCNVENASYGLTLCAERNALARVVVDGKKPVALAIVVDSRRPTPPCGACRQVIYELLPPDAPVITRTPRGKQTKYTAAKLLPDAFGPRDL